ncbi:Bac_transf domain-containing protein [Candidatus Hydrogenisulfobacillus filiaventi]|uniref:Bac_transf domain-containing protein n=1 Tax=Candidatus Hydrogenisulfobacillus filiaventi TaxID=2707344 RepID=A0A6F8ZD43_9FIRM|nr:sugar transferase [Bacillota bacterium]CAB1127851.1 Bac_transf domain-containing protein [Candidatus Hydrogenisulfobacillus filiaventi]
MWRKAWTTKWDELAVLVDSGAAYLAYVLAVHFYLTVLNPRVATVQLVTYYFNFAFVILVSSWLALKLNFKGYSRRWNQLPAEMSMLFVANLEAGVALALLIFAMKATWFSRVIFLLYPATAFGLQTLLHAAIKVSLSRFRVAGKDQRRLVVLGHPNRVAVFAHTVRVVPEAGMQVVEEMPLPLGDDRAGEEALRRLRQVLAEQVVDTVVVALPVSDEVMVGALNLARRQGKEVRMVLDEIGALARDSRLYDFYGNSVLAVPASVSHQGPGAVVKRVMDVVLASLGIVVTLPVMILVALAIKLTDPAGPVLFVQERVGLNGRRFPCLKFRTMVPGAERLKAQLAHLNIMSGPVFKIPDDPRVTPIGRFLRKTSLDELPQLFNVLAGHMSLVGPRPALPEEVAQYGDDYRKRLSVRPGLTCLWQVSGRNQVDFQEWMRLDMEYIDSWSLGLDLKILAKTIPAVLAQRGAH